MKIIPVVTCSMHARIRVLGEWKDARQVIDEIARKITEMVEFQTYETPCDECKSAPLFV